jgi:preprotein translocase subunit SecA
MLGIFKKLLGDPSQRIIDRIHPIVDEVNALEPAMQARSDGELRALTRQFQERIQSATVEDRSAIADLYEQVDREPDAGRRRELRQEIGRLQSRMDETERALLDEILPTAFAAVREAARRSIGMRHYDVQIIGGVVLHRNRIAEMKTGEGKTLVATLPLYLNALTGRGVHLVTPNDYLSKVGAQWMGPVYHLLGLSVGIIQSMGNDPSMSSFLFDPDYPTEDDRYLHLRPVSRGEAYQADITYGTNNEFGFDYLRDNMVLDLDQCVQRELYYAIVDEIDNIIIDEARTPLIISGQAEESTEWYRRFADIASRLLEGTHYVVDEKQRIVSATEEGISQVERMLGIDNIYSPEHYELTPYLENALKARALFQRDRNYIVQDGEVIIVDEFTGRLMYGRRYSEGLHQAIEAKEGVPVQRESLTLATITFQNYFRMYRRLAGMTGTAATEEEEFRLIYDLDVVVIPTHEPMIREDHPDVVFKSAEAKYRAALDEIKQEHDRGRPILVGTLAIETSEMISHRLERMGIPHEVLNAKYHEREAHIIAQAGRPGAVTIATNMAGRGVDILLGGNPEGMAREALRKKGMSLQDVESDAWEQALAEASEVCARDHERVVELGGLHVIGTERYEARRIDNQLRGRAGRQGDPGSSRFYVALDDELMRRFGGESLAHLMDRLGVDEDIPIEHDMVSRAIENAQVRVEGHNFDLRKHILEYDDVVNQQRQVIYDQRRLILSEPNLRPMVTEILEEVLGGLVAEFDAIASTDGGDDEGALLAIHATIDRMVHLPERMSPENWRSMSEPEIQEQLLGLLQQRYDEHEREVGVDLMRRLERVIMLRAIDRAWVDHLTALDELREGIGLRAVGQRNPLVEYKREAFAMFDQLLESVKTTIASMILNVRVQQAPAAPRPTQFSGASGGSAGSARPQQRRVAKVGRNDPCPCGSGKKYKHCCGR